MANFSLTFNPFTLFPSSGQILNHVKINRFITQYYQPLPGQYLLKSDQSAYILNDSFKGLFESTAYMLIQFDSRLTSGSLPQEIWNWINFGEVPPPLPVPSALGGLIDAGRRAGGG